MVRKVHACATNNNGLRIFFVAKFPKTSVQEIATFFVQENYQSATRMLKSTIAINARSTMSSCEPYRTSAYSEDLKWRIVWQSDALGHTSTQVAQNLGVDRSTVSRTLQLFHVTGSLSKKQYPKEKAFRKLTDPAKLLILYQILQNPGVNLMEIQEEVLNTLLIEVDISTICRFIHESGFTHQKLWLVAVQRDEFLRQQFTTDVSVYKPEMFVFIDETGADRRNILRRYGYSLRGLPLKQHTLLARGECVSGIAILSAKGILDVSIVQGTSNGDTFYDFVQEYLLPLLQPFNGINTHSVVVMDNCSIHHISEAVKMIEEVGAIVHFLPSYSPDLNPIEEAFSRLKES